MSRKEPTRTVAELMLRMRESRKNIDAHNAAMAKVAEQAQRDKGVSNSEGN
jgi:hypothetical protein